MKVAIIYNQDMTGVINKFGMQNKEIYNPKTVKKIANALEQGGHNVRIIDGNMQVIEALREFMPRVIEGERMGMVFNMAYGIQGESRYTHLPSMLEMLGIPYVGSNPAGHALALDKVITKIIMLKYGIPTPDFWVFSDADEDMSAVAYPAIVKPKMEAVSYGLSVVRKEKDLREAVAFIVEEFQQQALVEQFIRGREFCVGMLGNGGDIECFPVLEVDLENDPDAIQSVDDKKRKPRGKICPAHVSDELANAMKRISKTAFQALGLRDFARVDIRMDEDENIYVLEINSMASLGVTGSYVHAAGVAGYDYTKLVNAILDVATVRYFSETYSSAEIEAEKGRRTKPQSLSARIRAFLRSRQQKTETLLQKMVNINTHARNVEGVNALGDLVGRELSLLGFHQQVIPQVVIGNLLLFSNSQTNEYDVLLLGNLDCNVPFAKQFNFKSTEQRLRGSAIWEYKGGLAVMIAALQALRFVRSLRKLKIGILLTSDETLHGRFSRSHIEQITSRAEVILGLSGSSIDSTIVTSRSGAAVYHCQMKLLEAPDAEYVAKAVAEFSHLIASLSECAAGPKGLIVAPNHVQIQSNISDLSAFGETSVSVRFNQIELANDFDNNVKRLVKKRSREFLQIQIEGGIRRRPMIRTEAVRNLWEKTHHLAQKLDIRLLEEHRWSSSNICFADSSKSILDGLGPVGGILDQRNEFILRHSLLERATLMAMLLNQLK